MRSLKFIVSLFTLVLFIGCMKKEMPEIVTDFVGATVYYVSNETEIDLDVTYRIAETTIDSTAILPLGKATDILQYGGLGGHFQPSLAFDNLVFYKSSDTARVKPLLTFDIVRNNDWKIIPLADDNKIGYQLSITPEDID